MAKDYYTILGVARDASADEVKKAFRRLARQYHPDQATGDKKEAEQKFKEISEAYEILGDKQKRQQYDQFGSAGPGFGDGGAGFSGFDFGGFGDIFETFFTGSRARSQSSARRGADLEARVRIKFEEAIFGTTTKFRLERLRKCEGCKGNGAEPGSKIITCKTCQGTGEVTTTRQTIFGMLRHSAVCPDCSGEGKAYEKKCKVCHGTGRARKAEDVKVKIPAGVGDGAVIRLSGEGEDGAWGGSAGDLFIHIVVEPSRDFERRGSDVYSAQIIHLTQAVLGSELLVRTVHDDVKLKIPAGTQSHQTFKLKGYGVPKINSDERGDHFVKIIVDIPKKLSRKEKELIEEFAKEAGVKTAPKSFFR